VGAVFQRASPSVQQVQSAIQSDPDLQVYAEKFRDADICQSLPISCDELEDMGICNLEHQVRIKQLINCESQNILLLSGVDGRLCSEEVKEVENGSDLDMMSRSQTYSSMSCSTLSTEVSEVAKNRKKTLIMTIHQKRDVEKWILEKYRTNIPALKGWVRISDHWCKKNAFIVTYESEQTARQRHAEGVKYKLTIEKQNLRARKCKLTAKRKLEYTVTFNRGPRPSPKHPVRYRALCEQLVTAGKKELNVVCLLKEGQVVMVNQDKLTDVGKVRWRKVRIFNHVREINIGWVKLHSENGKEFLERLD